ncbi:MAG: hypothetical protein R3204_05165, partial [Oceanospirillum sp.]|nr:hypothetical protein [Oceanospirillum sp.]
PRYPTDKVLWLRQQAPLLHLSRWIAYQFQPPSLGVKKLSQQTHELQQLIIRLSGLMAEEMSLLRLADQQTVDEALIKRNQDDQYELILELGRHELSFNSLQQNLKR